MSKLRPLFPLAPAAPTGTFTPTPARDNLIDDQAGDVPGWVLVTLMTAALVTMVWAFAGPALEGLFERVLSTVSGIGA